jgi:hypothetical protein
MTTYQGTTSDDMDWAVHIIDGEARTELPWRLDLANHSPTGLAWGYGGSGPAQCALALLAHALGDDERAMRLYQRFKFRVVAALPRTKGWALTRDEILEHVAAIEAELNPC